MKGKITLDKFQNNEIIVWFFMINEKSEKKFYNNKLTKSKIPNLNDEKLMSFILKEKYIILFVSIIYRSLSSCESRRPSLKSVDLREKASKIPMNNHVIRINTFTLNSHEIIVRFRWVLVP